MQGYRIIEYGELNDCQKKQVAEIFLEGFGHMMTFSKDRSVLLNLFLTTWNPSLVKCYVEQDRVLGIMGLATNKVRPLYFDRDICMNLFGKTKGKILFKQMNAIFQTPVVTGDRDLYIDILATDAKARGRGVATALLKQALSLNEYDCYYIEVFSKNEVAFNLYKKVGFSIYKKEKLSPLRFMVRGSGYPIKMKRNVQKY